MLSVTHKTFMLSVIMLSAIMLSVAMLNVIMLNVVAPSNDLAFCKRSQPAKDDLKFLLNKAKVYIYSQPKIKARESFLKGKAKYG
jgi:hypothetical protein